MLVPSVPQCHLVACCLGFVIQSKAQGLVSLDNNSSPVACNCHTSLPLPHTCKVYHQACSQCGAPKRVSELSPSFSRTWYWQQLASFPEHPQAISEGLASETPDAVTA